MRELCYLFLTRFLPIMLDRKDRMGMAAGLEVRVPFCDHRLVQFVFNAPWAMKTFDGKEKSLLRAATRDLLPESIAARRKSPYPAIQNPAYQRILQENLATLVADGSGPALPLLNSAVLRDMLSAPPGSEHLARVPLELILYLNEWLDRYHVRVTA
jgi:asparagine synthase (glutamine-hydrolysing)